MWLQLMRGDTTHLDLLLASVFVKSGCSTRAKARNNHLCYGFTIDGSFGGSVLECLRSLNNLWSLDDAPRRFRSIPNRSYLSKRGNMGYSTSTKCYA